MTWWSAEQRKDGTGKLLQILHPSEASSIAAAGRIPASQKALRVLLRTDAAERKALLDMRMKMVDPTSVMKATGASSSLSEFKSRAPGQSNNCIPS